ncbi:conserved hypothetical protein [Thermosinus carboxydivorans Nor1]|uniref:Uncharacterized protein n=1 Tax=Thermosinus carboxydivorans Nor1 TaxID=401526 RepID=A1HPZ4_9FIRM|nr:CC/Se motif family (seleno)protein [Thermosinus carboxydivorans]EAX47846.1 conserved hypothetical protein [Thermosinus carboxydivorans Nor1]
MLTISPQALEYIKTRNQAIYLELPPLIDCCIHLREAPIIRFGAPPNLAAYKTKNIDGITVYIPDDLPDIPLTIDLSSFFGYKRLVIEGWRLA